jgi:hypothetical protein
LRFTSFAIINLLRDLRLQECDAAGLINKKGHAIDVALLQGGLGPSRLDAYCAADAFLAAFLATCFLTFFLVGVVTGAEASAAAAVAAGAAGAAAGVAAKDRLEPKMPAAMQSAVMLDFIMNPSEG